MLSPVTEPALSFVTRLVFAFTAFFRILFDGSFAKRTWQVRELPETPPATMRSVAPEKPEPVEEPEKVVEIAPSSNRDPSSPALILLTLFQQHGRFVDFIEEDIANFNDAEVGAVARMVHEGCRKALRDHAQVEAIRQEEEGQAVTVEEGFDANEIKLLGNIQGKGPFKGSLRHRGWRVHSLQLPTLLEGAAIEVVAPAEVEL
jgi:hypothetical protein